MVQSVWAVLWRSVAIPGSEVQEELVQWEMPESVIGDWVSWLFLIVSSPVCGIWGDAGSKDWTGS